MTKTFNMAYQEIDKRLKEVYYNDFDAFYKIDGKFEDTKTFLHEEIAPALKERDEKVREKVMSMKRILWSEDINQHNRNIERENTLNEILAFLASAESPEEQN